MVSWICRECIGERWGLAEFEVSETTRTKEVRTTIFVDGEAKEPVCDECGQPRKVWLVKGFREREVGESIPVEKSKPEIETEDAPTDTEEDTPEVEKAEETPEEKRERLKAELAEME